MFTLKNNKLELRNLEEQVQKNKEDIANHYAIDRALSNFGIKIVGVVPSEADLPDALTYEGTYGDGFAVGQPGSYVYYIYTRPDPNSGHPSNYWLNVGAISVVGPQGIQGEKGDKGDTGASSTWYFGTSPTTGLRVGDMLLNTNGEVLRFDGTFWQPTISIMGPQGIQGIQGIQGPIGPQGEQGPKGETGDVGGFINIWGILANTSQLPTPSSLNNLTVAYLVGAESPYDLYVQIGQTSSNAVWTNTGPFNAATLVMDNGVAQNIWDADTKVGFTDYAYNKAGVVKVTADGSYGLAINQSNGIIQINPANSNEIVAQGSGYKCVPVNRITLAVKEGLINPKSSYAWTDEDKIKAKQTLGINPTYKISITGGKFLITGQGPEEPYYIENDDTITLITTVQPTLYSKEVTDYQGQTVTAEVFDYNPLLDKGIIQYVLNDVTSNLDNLNPMITPYLLLSNAMVSMYYCGRHKVAHYWPCTITWTPTGNRGGSYTIQSM